MATITTTTTFTRALCPTCGQPASGVDHITDTNWYPPWCCDKCGHYYQVRRINGIVEVRMSAQSPSPEQWVLLKYGEIRLLVRTRKYFKAVDAAPDEAASEEHEHERYYYDEHTCPTNYLSKVEAVALGEETDPHGVFEFVDVFPVNGDENAEDVLGRIVRGED